MAKQYEADECSFNELVSRYSSMYVPPFQRPYKWGEEQIEELFDDVYKPMSWAKGVKALADEEESHYMGAVVLCKDGGRHMILDGQQRLTTLSILLAYLKAKMTAGANGDTKRQRKAILYGGRLIKQEASIDGNTDPILSPQEDDLKVYRQIIESEDLSIPLEFDPTGIPAATRRENKLLRKRNVFKAYKLIRDLTRDIIIKPAAQSGIDEFSALDLAASKLLNKLSVVVIEAHNESAAFRLFETLNARGLDLSAADLIKNNLFAIAQNEQQRADVRESWESVAESVNGDQVAFMRTFWLMDHDFVRKDGLFDAYKRELQARKNSEEFLKKFLESLVSAAEHYHEIVAPDDKNDHYHGLASLNHLGAKTCRPLLLNLKINRPHLLRDVIPLIESLTVRWMIAGKVFNVLETTYAKVAKDVSRAICDQKSDEQIVQIIYSTLNGLGVPDDETFALNFSKYSAPRSSKAVRYILCKINEELSSGGGEHVANPATVHIEHIFPQDPSPEALAHSEINEEESEDYSSRIGNLTLLAAKINMSIKNRAFPQKLSAEKGLMQSRLAINDDVKKATNWRKGEIDERSKRFAQIALRIWKW